MYEFTAVQDKMTVDWNNEVSLDANGYYVDYIYGSEYTLPTPDITGCTFKGWNPVGAGWKNTTDTEKIIVPGNNHLDFDALTDDCISLTAVVVANTYGISWDTCAVNDSVTITAAGTESVRFDEGSNITVPELSSDKWDYLEKTYTFEGWYTKKDGQGKKLDDSFDELITTDTTFYANWTASDRICTVTVIFENDESVSYEVGYGKIYEEVANVDYILETVVLEDNAYGEFAGWIVCDKAGNPKLDSDNKLQNWESYKSTKVDEDITLYPQWDYYLWLFGERVNSIESNKLKRNYAPNAAEGGVATFDISTFTITLDNCESVIKSEDALSSAQISNYYLDDGVRKYKYEQIKASILSKINTDTLNIELKGENLIDVVLSEINGGCNYGAIAICRSNLCIIDSQDNRGKLTVHVDDSGSSADYIFGICVPDDTYFQGSENSSPAVYLWIGCDIYNREKYFNQNAGLCGTYYMSDVILKGDKLNNLYGIIERNAGSLISGSLFILVDYVIRTGKKNNAIHTSFGSSMNEERNLDFNIVSDAAEYALFGIGEYYEYELWLHLPEFEAMDRYEAYKHQLSGKVYVGSYDKDFNHFRFRQCCAYGMNDMQLISDLLYDGFLEKNVGDE